MKVESWPVGNVTVLVKLNYIVSYVLENLLRYINLRRLLM